MTKCIVLTFDQRDPYGRELLTTMLQALAKQRTLAMVDGEHFGGYSLQCTTQQP